MKRLWGFALVAALLVTGLSCGDSTGPSGPGQIKVRLTSPNSGLDSAIVFTITGPAPLTSATAGTGLRAFQQPLGGTSTEFALVGLLAYERRHDPHDRGVGHARAGSIQRLDSRRGDAELSAAVAAEWLRARADPLVAGLRRRLRALPDAPQAVFQTSSQALI